MKSLEALEIDSIKKNFKESMESLRKSQRIVEWRRKRIENLFNGGNQAGSGDLILVDVEDPKIDFVVEDDLVVVDIDDGLVEISSDIHNPVEAVYPSIVDSPVDKNANEVIRDIVQVVDSTDLSVGETCIATDAVVKIVAESTAVNEISNEIMTPVSIEKVDEIKHSITKTDIVENDTFKIETSSTSEPIFKIFDELHFKTAFGIDLPSLTFSSPSESNRFEELYSEVSSNLNLDVSSTLENAYRINNRLVHASIMRYMMNGILQKELDLIKDFFLLGDGNICLLLKQQFKSVTNTAWPPTALRIKNMVEVLDAYSKSVSFSCDSKFGSESSCNFKIT